jgi:hypothetical protein
MKHILNCVHFDEFYNFCKWILHFKSALPWLTSLHCIGVKNDSPPCHFWWYWFFHSCEVLPWMGDGDMYWPWSNRLNVKQPEEAIRARGPSSPVHQSRKITHQISMNLVFMRLLWRNGLLETCRSLEVIWIVRFCECANFLCSHEASGNFKCVSLVLIFDTRISPSMIRPGLTVYSHFIYEFAK